VSNPDKVMITCALTGVLTDPEHHPVPVTPQEMADAAARAHDAGACAVHVHFRQQGPGMGRFPSWDPDVAEAIVSAIRHRVPDLILNLSTGVVGDDISGPLACLERVVPDMAAMNAGSLNYLRTRKDGRWAWPPMLFDNSVAKIERFTSTMARLGVVPECECFDTGIVRSIEMFHEAGLLRRPAHVSFVMGVASGMPARTDLLPILIDEAPKDADWQAIVIGRSEVWPVHRRVAELGGNLRTGVEDTFYLPSGGKVEGNGPLVEAMCRLAREVGREPMTPAEARAWLDT
jgi:uncharacterized protein (DUF849 family)